MSTKPLQAHAAKLTDKAASEPPRLERLEELLRRAVSEFPWPDTEPTDSLRLRDATRHIAETEPNWLQSVPSFLELRAWVERHWHPERETRLPKGVVREQDSFGNEPETQLDATAAACKLIFAARLHGLETVAKSAKDFASHGMLESVSLCLLKGAETERELHLDHHCSIIPYREALPALRAPSEISRASEQGWPPENTKRLCVLEIKTYEFQGSTANDVKRYRSPLVPGNNPEPLAYILGVVWGKGIRACGARHWVNRAFIDTIPFLYRGASDGSYCRQTSAPLFLMPRKKEAVKPLNLQEVSALTKKYLTLSGQSRQRADLALRRLCDGADRIDLGDRAIDVCIALEALFMDDGEQWKHKKLIARRCSWYFADRTAEREEARERLRSFYDLRSNIVHGKAILGDLAEDQHEEHLEHINDVENMVRASLKTMISEGRPRDWDASRCQTAIRQEPRRTELEIPSIKSDSMSWSLSEQRRIDRALESVWKPTIDNAPDPGPGARCVVVQGVDRETIREYKKRGTYYIVMLPASLYMAHPKWVVAEGEALDERMRYYCEIDVRKHFKRWHAAASERKVCLFHLPLEEPEMYSHKGLQWWRDFIERRVAD